ncbi:anthranilate synthase component I [Microbulbifer thermotolerans]|uniref:Anthranilate synthase component 1 n=1 Tax=Microbulbifer thermotolerans TaxID=252514 RepID=A0AB35I1Z6_MICTH|nr:anthranilate synthase component I [Microbulbifer thermotolerans]MCX2778380.1 anthranilate synthase component I [Microbulbifer thermotolerans]MCX2784202.1 anthranilate synthase component I [Microbulbifer thermotolerans]MCX2803016.1 anthranilate synthase component I [Microbulbifer thermotolerans]MCX2804419.1 anthranilate synthase component I [Microbulbifer thermotolerans]MCX2832567.1 anthranilate synthase component I [Microbulbifer thermotolerans]
MTPSEYAQLVSAGYNRIPLVRRVLADVETPLSTYIKLAAGPYSYLLESVQGGEKWGRYSIIGLPARTLLRVCGHEITVERDGEVIERCESADPLAFVEEFQRRYRVPELPDLPRFNGGLVGYFGYDCVRYIEPRLADSAPPDTLGNPDILLMVSDELVVFDNLAGAVIFIVHADPEQEDAYDRAQSRLDQLVGKLAQPLPAMVPLDLNGAGIDESAFKSHFGEENFKRAVDRVKEYILAGDVMQVVPSQRLSAPYEAPPLNLYRALRSLNPSPYMYFLDLDDHQVVGSSPEILVHLEAGEMTVRPLAGTRRRGVTEEEDRALEEELLADPKEIAEHLMLIDLGRNDVGRVAQTGSVRVTEQMVVERYSHVMHIVSNVTGQLKSELGGIDALRAALPAGTLSGAPKIRAMEIIDELEPEKRGIYGGAVGYLAWNGNMDTAIAIRTAVIKNGQLYIQAGAGLVADSQPQSEWDETMNKARALFRAAAIALSGV